MMEPTASEGRISGTPTPSAHRSGTPVLLSIVVPCLDEEAVLAETHSRLAAVFEAIPGLECEFVYVDDGSRDTTLDLLRGLQHADERVRVLVLSRNFGQQAAITAGLTEAVGDVVAVIDADLQDPPEAILEMLDRWRQGADVAYGLRVERGDDTRMRTWTAAAFYYLLSRLSNTSIPPNVGDFRVMDRAVVDAFLSMPERNRFFRGMVAWTGFRQERVPIRRAKRYKGRTKYSYGKMLRLAVGAIMSFSSAPLYLATWVGVLAAGLALSGAVYALAVRLLTDTWVSGWTSLLIAIGFLGGVQLVFLGVLGGYLGRIYGEVKRRPLYLVRERVGFARDGSARSPEEPGE